MPILASFSFLRRRCCVRKCLSTIFLVALVALRLASTQATWAWCDGSVSSNGLTIDSDKIRDGVRFRLQGAYDDDRRRRRGLFADHRKSQNQVQCNNGDYDFVVHCKINGVNYDGSSDSRLTQYSGKSETECLALCAATWNDGVSTNRCHTVQWHDQNGQECTLSTLRQNDAEFSVVYNSDSHHWCYRADGSTCFDNPTGITDMDSGSTSCTNTADGDTCNYACVSGFAPGGGGPVSCTQGSWVLNGATCEVSTCSANPTGIANMDTGSTSCTNTADGNTCNYACLPGFVPGGGGPVSCTQGSWVLNGATCEALPQCLSDGSTTLAHSNASTAGSFPSAAYAGDAVVVQCDEFYRGGGVWACSGVSGSFEGSPCTAIGCENIIGTDVENEYNAQGGTCASVVSLDVGETCAFAKCAQGTSWSGDSDLSVGLVELTCELDGSLVTSGGTWSCDSDSGVVEGGGNAVIAGVTTGATASVASSFVGFALPLQILVTLIVDSMQFFVALSVVGGRTAAVHRELAHKFGLVLLNNTHFSDSIVDRPCGGEYDDVGANATTNVTTNNITTINTTTYFSLEYDVACVQTSLVWAPLFFAILLGAIGVYWALFRAAEKINGRRKMNDLPTTAILASSSSCLASHEPSNWTRFTLTVFTRFYTIVFLPLCVAFGYVCVAAKKSSDDAGGYATIASFLAFVIFLPPFATMLLYLRDRDVIAKFEREHELTNFDKLESLGGKWWHHTLWSDMVAYRFGLLWPLVEFLRSFAVGVAVGVLQSEETVEMYNFLALFAIELLFVIVIIKIEPFRDRLYAFLKLMLHAINITASAVSVGYVGSDGSGVKDVGLTVVWLFLSAWIIALIGLVYLAAIRPLLLRAGVPCVQPKHVRERTDLETELATKQRDLENQILDKIGSSDLVVDMRSIELGIKLGAGGAGIVYKAKMSGMDVVVKSLISQMMENDVEEFIREASMLAKLRHPNVTVFYGIGVKNDSMFLVQEYCSSGSLRDFMRTRDFKSNKSELAAKFAMQLFRTVDYLHSRSVPIIHRDLKPDNLLISEGRVMKVGDLGTSREQSADDLSMTEGAAGTILYMPPEAIRALYRDKRRASIIELDGRKWDVFSCALCVLYMYNGGVDPYDDWGRMKIVRMILENDAKPTIAKRVPQGVARVVRAMWHSNSTKRPTMREAGKMFESWLSSRGNDDGGEFESDDDEYGTGGGGNGSSTTTTDGIQGGNATTTRKGYYKSNTRRVRNAPKAPRPPPSLSSRREIETKKKEKKKPDPPPVPYRNAKSGVKRGGQTKKKKAPALPPPLPKATP